MAHRIYRLRSLWPALNACDESLKLIKKFETASELVAHVNGDREPPWCSCCWDELDYNVIYFLEMLAENYFLHHPCMSKEEIAWDACHQRIVKRAEDRAKGDRKKLITQRDFRAILSLWKKFADKHGLFEEA